jgi:hypothetical protein
LTATPVNWKQAEDPARYKTRTPSKTYPQGWKAPRPYIRIVQAPRTLQIPSAVAGGIAEGRRITSALHFSLIPSANFAISAAVAPAFLTEFFLAQTSISQLATVGAVSVTIVMVGIDSDAARPELNVL